MCKRIVGNYGQRVFYSVEFYSEWMMRIHSVCSALPLITLWLKAMCGGKSLFHYIYRSHSITVKTHGRSSSIPWRNEQGKLFTGPLLAQWLVVAQSWLYYISETHMPMPGSSHTKINQAPLIWWSNSSLVKVSSSQVILGCISLTIRK